MFTDPVKDALGLSRNQFSNAYMIGEASENVIMIWFDKNRGKVNAISSVAISFGFSSYPLWVNALIEGYSWQGDWRILAGGLLVIIFL